MLFPQVNDAEHRKDNLQSEHKKMILSCSDAENRCQILRKALKKPVKKAKYVTIRSYMSSVSRCLIMAKYWKDTC